MYQKTHHPELIGIVDTWRTQELLHTAQSRIDTYRRGQLVVSVNASDGRPLEAVPVHIQQTSHAFQFGCAALSLHSHQQPAVEALYQKLFLNVFNFATIMVFWHEIEKSSGAFNLELHLKRAKTLKSAGVTVKGHPLILPGVCPSWVSKDPDLAKKSVERWIRTMVHSFRGLIDTWDVVGDIWTGDTAQNGIGEWIRKVGRDAVFADALRWTKSENPKANTLYNDFALDNAFQDLIRKATKSGAPVDTLGLEAHMSGAGWPLEQLWVHADTFGKLKLPLHFSEITVGSESLTPSVRAGQITTRSGEARQAEYVETMYRILFSHPLTTGICWWNLVDGDWGNNAGGLLRSDMTPKPAYDVIERLIKDEWTTNTVVRTNHLGEVDLPVYAGAYKISCPAMNGVESARSCTVKPRGRTRIQLEPTQ